MVATQSKGFKHVPYYPCDTFICTFPFTDFHFAVTQDTHDGYILSPFVRVAFLCL